MTTNPGIKFTLGNKEWHFIGGLRRYVDRGNSLCGVDDTRIPLDLEVSNWRIDKRQFYPQEILVCASGHYSLGKDLHIDEAQAIDLGPIAIVPAPWQNPGSMSNIRGD